MCNHEYQTHNKLSQTDSVSLNGMQPGDHPPNNQRALNRCIVPLDNLQGAGNVHVRKPRGVLLINTTMRESSTAARIGSKT